ncbi:MAG: peptidoglycan-binding protein [Myxococcaceae bacterium]|jgi:hypothetical protein|nr:peptidoglycan-binding protein [Myxococcaceae bacterium]
MWVQLGNRGANVAAVQRELLAAGLNPGPVDGDFGPRTLAAVRAYQRRFGLTLDGIVGPQTWGKLQTDGFQPSGARPTTPGSGGVVTPVPSTPGGRVQAMLDEARSHLGYHEGAGNQNMFSSALGRPPEPWCADFVSYVARRAGFSVNTASAQGVANFLEQRGTWKGRSDPQPGDAVTFRWDGSGGWADHVGIVERVYRQNGRLYVQTIEGNSSDQVRRKTYAADDPVINGYGSMA